MDRGDRDRLHDNWDDEEAKSPISPALIATGVLVAVIVVFVLQNRERTQIDFLFVEVRSRVWVALAIAVALGVVLDRVVSMWWRRRRARKG